MAPLTAQASNPKSVNVNLTSGAGVDIDWADGHHSHYPFTYLRDACPCALCDEERRNAGRQPGDPPHSKPGELPMFRPAAKPVRADPVGRYAIRFDWSDGHMHGIYSWELLRQLCPCAECKSIRNAGSASSSAVSDKQ